MAQHLGQRQDTRLGLQVRVSPSVLMSAQMLQLGQAELSATIESELAENPALDRLDEDDPITHEALMKAVAPCELKSSSEDNEFRRSLPQGSEDVDWVDLASGAASLNDYLRGQLLAGLPASLHGVAEFVAGCVDERGYLDTSVEEIALATNVSLEEATSVLKSLKQCDPAGVGASDVRECLYLQLRGDQTIEGKVARQILKQEFDAFLHGNVKSLSRKLHCMPELIEAAFDRIRSLQPYPGESFMPYSVTVSNTSGPAVVPDLVLSYSEQGWLVETRGPNAQSLTIDRAYRDKYQAINKGTKICKDEKRHITEYVERAQTFIASLEKREQTLLQIGRYLIEHQGGFVSTGQSKFLQPLTRSKMAQDLSVHESTISRATADKFVQLASGEVVSFDIFFKSALRVQRLIEEMLANENPDNPLSDERIAALLAERGVMVARRTVNKYRDRTKLLSSRRRRSA